jgi:hypothetical protein
MLGLRNAIGTGFQAHLTVQRCSHSDLLERFALDAVDDKRTQSGASCCARWVRRSMCAGQAAA